MLFGRGGQSFIVGMAVGICSIFRKGLLVLWGAELGVELCGGVAEMCKLHILHVLQTAADQEWKN